MTVIERARLLVDDRPPAIEGQGGNATTFGIAEVLVWGFGLSPAEAMPIFLDYNQRCVPPWPDRELARMCNSVVDRQHDKPRGYLVGEGAAGDSTHVPLTEEKPKRSKVKEMRLDALKRAQDDRLNFNMDEWRKWLADRSICDPSKVTPETYLDSLYKPGEKILIFNHLAGQGHYGRHIGSGTYLLGQIPGEKGKRVKELPPGSPEGMLFLMQPVDAEWRLKKGTNELSRRTRESITRWPYILLETDKAPFELWLNVIVQARIPVVSITASGGRSLHALVRVDKETSEELEEELNTKGARETLVVMGCDFQALKGVVYPRLPNTYREGKKVGKTDAHGDPVFVTRANGSKFRPQVFRPFREGRVMQRLLYFNPYAELGMSIADETLKGS